MRPAASWDTHNEIVISFSKFKKCRCILQVEILQTVHFWKYFGLCFKNVNTLILIFTILYISSQGNHVV
jgi:hypothetical protein